MYDFIYRDDNLQGCDGDVRINPEKRKTNERNKFQFGCPPIPPFTRTPKTSRNYSKWKWDRI